MPRKLHARQRCANISDATRIMKPQDEDTDSETRARVWKFPIALKLFGRDRAERRPIARDVPDKGTASV
jgi:hypothetical protein